MWLRMSLSIWKQADSKLDKLSFKVLMIGKLASWVLSQLGKASELELELVQPANLFEYRIVYYDINFLAALLWSSFSSTALPWP